MVLNAAIQCELCPSDSAFAFPVEWDAVTVAMAYYCRVCGNITIEKVGGDESAN